MQRDAALYLGEVDINGITPGTPAVATGFADYQFRTSHFDPGPGNPIYINAIQTQNVGGSALDTQELYAILQLDVSFAFSAPKNVMRVLMGTGHRVNAAAANGLQHLVGVLPSVLPYGAAPPGMLSYARAAMDVSAGTISAGKWKFWLGTQMPGMTTLSAT